MSSIRVVQRLLLVASAALGGGSNPFEREEPDLRVCPQTIEFGNCGCARIEGRVLDRDGRATTGRIIDVVLRGVPRDDGSLTVGVTQPDSTGWFRTGVTLFGAPSGDSVDLVLRTSVRPAGLSL